MRSATVEELISIFAKTGGRCHLCRSRLVLRSYGALGARGAWERDHSVPRACGGSNALRNLYPACISCNRSKQHRSSASVRRLYGFRSAPLSRAKMAAIAERDMTHGAAIGAFIAVMHTPTLQSLLGGAMVGAAVGASLTEER